MNKILSKLIAESMETINERLGLGTMDVDRSLRDKLIEIEFQTHYMPQYDPTEVMIQMDELYSLRNVLTANQINELFQTENDFPSYFKNNINDAMNSYKHISLTEEFWHGMNPYFWDD